MSKSIEWSLRTVIKRFVFLSVIGLALAGLPAGTKADNANMPFPALMNSLFGPDGSRATPRRSYQPRRAAPLPRSYGRQAAPLPGTRQRAHAGNRAPVYGSRRGFDRRFERRVVNYETREKPGTIVIDKSSKYLYLVQANGKAIRYGVGVGRPGFSWQGTYSITRKAEWPSWRPPEEMKKRQPWLPDYMEGGPGNPMGARALYIGNTLYRVHGTNEPWTIGQEMSSGCIRLRNEDVIHLYERVRVGARIKVI